MTEEERGGKKEGGKNREGEEDRGIRIVIESSKEERLNRLRDE